MAAEKEYNPAEPEAITLTAKEWNIVLHWLEYGTDYHMARKAEVLANCKDHRLAANMVETHENLAAKAETICKAITAVLYPAPPTETE